MSPVVHLVLAILIGMAVGLFTALRRYGGFVTFIVSTASFTLGLRIWSQFALYEEIGQQK